MHPIPSDEAPVREWCFATLAVLPYDIAGIVRFWLDYGDTRNAYAVATEWIVNDDEPGLFHG